MEKIKEIINFAIDREHEAARFYRELQDKVMHHSSKHFLKELEMMELGHAKTLSAFDIEKISKEFTSPEILDLRLSDYLDDIEPRKDMTFQEVLIIAMKREESAMNLYSKLANQVEDEATKNIFLKLSSEEARHKSQLETVYDEEVYKEN